MAGSKIGGLKAKESNLREHGQDFYERIGGLGGKKTKADGCKPKGFAADPNRARTAGTLGGQRSSRKGVTNKKRVDNSNK